MTVARSIRSFCQPRRSGDRSSGQPPGLTQGREDRPGKVFEANSIRAKPCISSGSSPIRTNPKENRDRLLTCGAEEHSQRHQKAGIYVRPRREYVVASLECGDSPLIRLVCLSRPLRQTKAAFGGKVCLLEESGVATWRCLLRDNSDATHGSILPNHRGKVVTMSRHSNSMQGKALRSIGRRAFFLIFRELNRVQHSSAGARGRLWVLV